MYDRGERNEFESEKWMLDDVIRVMRKKRGIAGNALGLSIARHCDVRRCALPSTRRCEEGLPDAKFAMFSV